jgi:predicted O-methyltransferase YrrM
MDPSRMGTTIESLLARLHPADPYRGFPYADYSVDLDERRKNPVLTRLVEELRPRLVVEVGSWKGWTAIEIASQLRRMELDAAVVCVDTWLGSVEHWDGSAPSWDVRPLLKHGYPTLYFQFLANVMHKGCSDLIVPLPNTSANAAKLLARHRVSADLVYIDASHEEEDVYRDLCDYWRLLRPGGVMAGDDWHARWYGVICAVNRFVKEHRLPLEISGMTSFRAT